MPGTTNYPTSLDGTNLSEPATNADRSGAGNEDQRETNRLKVLVQAVKALEAKLGIGSTTAVAASTGQIVTKQGDGTTAWATPAAGATLASSVTAATTYDLAASVGSSGNVAREDHGHGSPARPTLTETFTFGDATGTLAITPGRYIWSPMRQVEIIAVRAVLWTASTSGNVSVDVNSVNYSTGTATSILTASGGNLLVASGSRSAARTVSPAALVVGSTDGITVDLDGVGTAAKYLTVTIRHQET
jgi:hypothetical protein